MVKQTTIQVLLELTWLHRVVIRFHSGISQKLITSVFHLVINSDSVLKVVAA